MCTVNIYSCTGSSLTSGFGGPSVGLHCSNTIVQELSSQGLSPDPSVICKLLGAQTAVAQCLEENWYEHANFLKT